MKNTPKFLSLQGILTILGALLCATGLHAQSIIITTTGSGNWSSTVPNAPWPGGVVPAPTNDVIVASGDTVTVDVPEVIDALEILANGRVQNNSTLNVAIAAGNTNVSAGIVWGAGTFTQGANSLLTPAGGTSTGAEGAIATLDTSAVGNTVNYTNNAFFAKRQDYYNVNFTGFGNFYNGNVGFANDPAGPMTVAGNLTTLGANVQMANDISVGGDLTIGAGSKFDASVGNLTVTSNTYIGGTLTDGDSAAGNNIFSNVTIEPSGTWAVSDVPTWNLSGSLTNNGTITSINYGGFTFTGSGVLAGSAGINVQSLTLYGTYEISTSVTVGTNLFLGGDALIVDINNQSSSNFLAYSNTDIPLTFAGDLIVTNVGGPLMAGDTFQLFSSASGFSGFFNSETLPPLPYGLGWDDSGLTGANGPITGTLVVTSTVPVVTVSQSGGNLVLTYDSASYPGFILQGQTNRTGITTNWFDVADTSSGSPITIPINKTNAAAFFRLVNTNSP